MATPTSLTNNIQADASPITQMFRVGLPEVQAQFTYLGGIGEVPEDMWNVSKYDIESLIPDKALYPQVPNTLNQNRPRPSGNCAPC